MMAAGGCPCPGFHVPSVLVSLGGFGATDGQFGAVQGITLNLLRNLVLGIDASCFQRCAQPRLPSARCTGRLGEAQARVGVAYGVAGGARFLAHLHIKLSSGPRQDGRA